MKKSLFPQLNLFLEWKIIAWGDFCTWPALCTIKDTIFGFLPSRFAPCGELPPTVASHCCTYLKKNRLQVATKTNSRTSGGVGEAGKPKHRQTDVISSFSPRPCSRPRVAALLLDQGVKSAEGLGRRKRGVMGQNEEPCQECLWSLKTNIWTGCDPSGQRGHWVFGCVRRGHGC